MSENSVTPIWVLRLAELVAVLVTAMATSYLAIYDDEWLGAIACLGLLASVVLAYSLGARDAVDETA